MTTRRPQTTPSTVRATVGVDTRDDETRSPWFLGLVEGVQAALLGVIIVAVVAVIAWIFSSTPLGTMFTVVTSSVQVWLLSHGAPVTYPHGTFGLSPWLVTAVLIWLCYRAGRRITISHSVASRRRKAARTPSTSKYATAISWAAMAVTYAVIVLVIAAAMNGQPLPVKPLRAAVSALVLALISGGVGVLRIPRKHRGNADDFPARILRGRLSELLGETTFEFAAGVVRAVLIAVGLIFAAAFILLVVTLIVHWHEFRALYGTLGAGGGDAAVLTAGQIFFLPNLIVWAASWTTGPGFAIGAGSAISPFGTSIGPIPAVPILAGIPADVSSWASVFVVVPALAGLAAGWWMLSQGIETWTRQLAAAVFIGLMAGIVLGLLGWLSGGSIGPGLLAVTGPPPVMFASVAASGVFVGAALALLAGPRLVPTTRKAARRISAGARAAELKVRKTSSDR